MQLTQITPFILCADLQRAIGFYRDRLGFVLGYEQDNYAFLKRDRAAIRLLEVGDEIDLSVQERQNSFYIDVQGIDALYAALQPQLEGLPNGRVRPPFDQGYGQREFHVSDEDCTLIFFGERIP